MERMVGLGLIVVKNWLLKRLTKCQGGEKHPC